MCWLKANTKLFVPSFVITAHTEKKIVVPAAVNYEPAKANS